MGFLLCCSSVPTRICYGELKTVRFLIDGGVGLMAGMWMAPRLVGVVTLRMQVVGTLLTG